MIRIYSQPSWGFFLPNEEYSPPKLVLLFFKKSFGLTPSRKINYLIFDGPIANMDLCLCLAA